MDPTANLEEQLALARAILTNENDAFDPSGDAGRLAELVQALDTWLARGGFLPRAWERK